MFFVVKLNFCFNIMIFCNGTNKRQLKHLGIRSLGINFGNGLFRFYEKQL